MMLTLFSNCLAVSPGNSMTRFRASAAMALRAGLPNALQKLFILHSILNASKALMLKLLGSKLPSSVTAHV